MCKLIYVSNNGINKNCICHPFFEQEKEILFNRYGEFFVVSSAGIFKVEKDNVKKTHGTGKKDKILAWFKAFNKDLFREILHMISNFKCTPKRLIKLFRFTKRGVMLENFIKMCNVDTPFLYSYWISYDGYAVARQKRKNPKLKALARAHAFDIQLSRNDANPYLMKRIICKYIDKIAFISKNGYEDFLGYYQKEQENFSICYLGSKSELSGFVERNYNDGITMVSCSSVIEIKRLDLIIDALKKWTGCKIKWIHIGDGALFDEIKEKAKNELDKNPLVEYEFLGRLSNKEVSSVLKREDVNLFVNSSRMEGVPVSIMEAMSVGLPIIAPRVGGIPELVTPGTGILFDDDNLYDALCKFSQLTVEEKVKSSAAAYEMWKEKFCLEENDEALFKEV